MRQGQLCFFACYLLGLIVMIYLMRTTEMYYKKRIALLTTAEEKRDRGSSSEISLSAIEKEDAGLHDDIETVTEQNVEIQSTTSTLASSTSQEFEVEKTQLKYIMYYNSPSLEEDTTGRGFEGCEYSGCIAIHDPTKADLIVFDGVEMKDVIPPKTKPPGQIWMMRTREAPTSKRFPYLRRADLYGQFNWSFTIFDDSTFQHRYGRLAERRQLLKKNYDEIYRRKKYDAAWFVSHCHTSAQRENYVKRMLPYITVHIYGNCGDRECGVKGHQHEDYNAQCFELLSKDYKFYLSFENSLCRDYVTEKFFNMFDDVDVIPVVRGGADYHRLFPSGTFINTADFSSPEELGKYLALLSRDKKRYVTMLERKNRYMPADQLRVKCDFCKALHLKQPVNVYPGDIMDWFNRSENCWSPKDL